MSFLATALKDALPFVKTAAGLVVGNKIGLLDDAVKVAQALEGDPETKKAAFQAEADKVRAAAITELKAELEKHLGDFKVEGVDPETLKKIDGEFEAFITDALEQVIALEVEPRLLALVG